MTKVLYGLVQVCGVERTKFLSDTERTGRQADRQNHHHRLGRQCQPLSPLLSQHAFTHLIATLAITTTLAHNNITYEPPCILRPLSHPHHFPSTCAQPHYTPLLYQLASLPLRSSIADYIRTDNALQPLGPSAITTLGPAPSPLIDTASCPQLRAI